MNLREFFLESESRGTDIISPVATTNHGQGLGAADGGKPVTPVQGADVIGDGEMTMTEEMFRTIAMEVNGTLQVEYQGNIIDFACAENNGKWQRISMIDSLTTIGGMESSIIGDSAKLLEFADQQGIKITKKERYGKILTKLFDTLVEPKLIQPTFITGYPVEVSPLSRKSDTDPELTDRFELFIAGREIANGFSEINDPADQYERFLQQVSQRT